MLYISLFYEFFKIGFLSFGGGYATIPFLYHLTLTHNWFTPDDLERMIAVSSITPGPVGINMATYTGMQTSGIIGAIISTIALVIPSFIIVISISKILKNFKENFFIKSIIYGLKPASCALLTAVTIDLIINNITNIPALLVLAIFLILSFKTKKDPLFYLGSTGLIGLILKYLSLI